MYCLFGIECLLLYVVEDFSFGILLLSFCCSAYCALAFKFCI